MTARGFFTARELALALGGDGRPDASGNYQCHCPGPSHKRGDRTPSLSVKDGRNGRPVLFCFAGCGYDEIAAALEARGLRL